MNDAVRLVNISRGAVFEIDLSRFAESEPAFAYVDDVRGGLDELRGLVTDGRITVADRPAFMWLQGPRDCVRLRVTPEGAREGRVSFRSKSVGEFCLEIYRLRPDGGAELVHQNDFCFK